MVGRIPVMDVMPVVDLGRQPAKATVGEPFPVSATVFREGHDRLAAEVVLTAPDGSRRPPVRMVKHERVPDRYDAWVTPDARGAWTFEIHAWGDPVATWEHNAGLKIPAGVDVDLMFEEGRVLCEKVLARSTRPAARASAAGAIDAAADPGRPPPRGSRCCRTRTSWWSWRPTRSELATVEGPYRRTPTGLARCSALVRVLPRSEGASRSRRHRGQRHLQDRRRAARRRRRDGLRRHLPAAGPPDRRGQPQGPEQHPHPRPGRPGSPWAIGSKDGGHDAIHPDLGTIEDFDAFVARPATSASRSPWTSRSRPPPTTPGSSPPSGSRRGSTAPSPTPRTRRRSTRTLPDQLDKDPVGICRGGAPGGQALDGSRRPDLPRRQPAHQAGRVLGLASRRSAGQTPT